VIDWGYPGVLPVMNKAAIEFGMKAALALNCEISKETHFDRKNYFYPDNPKAYQISQFDQPIGHDGWIEIEVEGKKKKIRIERVHLEEDAGKNMHGKGGYSYVDLNRQGTPLIEIVSEADMRSPEEAYAYLEALRSIILFTEVSDVKMEEGSMRCDANISLRPYGQEQFGTKTELKNLNSMSFVKKGLAFEEKRQAKVLLSGGEILFELIVPSAIKRIIPAKLSGVNFVSGSSNFSLFRYAETSPINQLEACLGSAPASMKNGKDRAVGFLVGQIMKATKGQANPGVVNKLLQEELAKR